MGRLGIVQAGNPGLRRRADPVPERLFNTPELQGLIDLMKTTMRRAPGVGLAAPQIGVPLQVIVLEDTEALMQSLTKAEREERGRIPIPFDAWINPMMEPLANDQAEFFEGCLSVLGYEAKVKRYVRIKVEGLDQQGQKKGPQEMSGWPARIIQHELDHLAGTLYVDRMDPRTFASATSREADAVADLLASLKL
jgi:peptide deformylase